MHAYMHGESKSIAMRGYCVLFLWPLTVDYSFGSINKAVWTLELYTNKFLSLVNK